MLCIFIYYLMTTYINFAVSVILMSNNGYFVQYHFNIIPFTYNSNIVGCFTNRSKNKLFMSASRQLMTSICFRIGLDLDVLIPVLSFEVSWSTFHKMADFQGIKDSSDIFLSDNNLSLIRLYVRCQMISYFGLYSGFIN